jgi:amino acid permease
MRLSLRHTPLPLLLLIAATHAVSPASRSPAPILGAARRASQSGATTHLLAAAAEPPPVSVGTTVLQIVNNVAGAGILTLAAGMAGGVGSIPAAALCLALGLISGFSFYLIGAACEATGQTSFKGLWAQTLGASTTWIVDASIALMCLSAAIIYSGILGDVFTQLLAFAGVPDRANVRSINIAALTAFAVAPLSLLKDLSALAFTSLLGCVAVMYTVVFVVTRGACRPWAIHVGRANCTCCMWLLNLLQAHVSHT